MSVPSYSRLEPQKIIETLEQLNKRINERFPGRGLGEVCTELTDLAKQTSQRAETLSRPNRMLRMTVILTVFVGLGLIGYLLYILPFKNPNEGFILFQGVEAMMNTFILVVAAAFSAWTVEQRVKRAKALKYLNELNAITHVIDMHQLTKDPSFVVTGGPKTESSPEREFTPFLLTRYLDYCSELLSLTAKLAAIYSQSTQDMAIVKAAGDIEQHTTNMSRKIWQKIMITQKDIDALDAA